jgi:flagellar biosynthesis/type III secretory pathway M-ring protein FliF/YscJ
MGVDAITSSLADWLSLFPSLILIFIVIAGLWYIVFGPLLIGGEEDRAAQRNSAQQSAEADAKRKELLASIISVCSDYDDWLDTNILILQIDCAGHPTDSQRAELLAEFIAARKKVSSLFIHIDSLVFETPDVDPEEIAKQWDGYRQQLQNLPPLNQVA